MQFFGKSRMGEARARDAVASPGLPIASSTAVLLVADCADAGGRHVLTADEDEGHGKENADERT